MLAYTALDGWRALIELGQEKNRVSPSVSLSVSRASLQSTSVCLCPPSSIPKGQRYINPGLPILRQLRPQSLTG